ncbi:MAG: bifunctional 23S rRNA (guanine(2069)-N(7))-methyltransferase RlmK/23S rRNA (guanine(2445)-N(2))-methyltransferase RlmL [Gammaproteobacteria bacterium]
MPTHTFFATCPKALEPLLAEELTSLGAQAVQQTVAGASFQGSLATAYRVCLWSRVANRVLLVLSRFTVNSQNDLYRGIQNINWFEHMRPDSSLAVTFNAKNSKAISNSHFGALKVKDAIVDQMQAKFRKRPNIDIERPDIRVNVFLHGENARLSLDLSGDSLHKRGYRDTEVAAPIKENLAAAVLLRADWPKIAAQGGTLLDPMCGSGTLLLEGAMIAADFAPGLMREHYGFLGWKQHDIDCWRQLLDDARRRKTEGLSRLPMIVGFDKSRHSIGAAQKNIECAGLAAYIHVERRDIVEAEAAASWRPGLLVANPPYGERLGDAEETAQLYKRFGDVLKSRFAGWQVALIIGDREMGFRLGVRSQKPITVYNGALECSLLRMTIEENAFFTPKAKSEDERLEQITRDSHRIEDIDGSDMFANRLRKNFKKLGKWARQNGIGCYRVYDADLPEYAVAVDLYQSDKLWVNVQEYEAPKTVDRQKADRRLADCLAEVRNLFEIDDTHLALKIRRRQKNIQQYEKQADLGRFHVVEEGGCKLWVNFEDYLDTGLFLDHRPLRAMIRQQAKDKRFLNLFSYTGSATVHAAVGGARSSVSVDMSNTYLQWAERNLALNGIRGDHVVIRDDCTEWLKHEAERQKPGRFDLILLDPPTFSNSKRMDTSFDIQNDHVMLIKYAVRLLAPGGKLYFSTNFRRFKLDAAALAGLTIEDITRSTIPEDFARNPKIHYCWSIQI